MQQVEKKGPDGKMMREEAGEGEFAEASYKMECEDEAAKCDDGR